MNIEAMKRREIDVDSKKIDKIIERINVGDIKIPAFQRGFVWEQDQVLDLLDSIYNDYPIGSILLWRRSNDDLRSIRNIAGYMLPDREPDYPLNYVLDGQQRLSSIWGVLNDKDDLVHEETDIDNPDPEIFDIVFDFEDEQFKSLASCKEVQNDNIDLFKKPKRKTYIKLSTLFNFEKFFNELNQLDERFINNAKFIQSKFSNYEVPIITVSGRTKEEVGTIFERINNTGTKLGIIDLMIAWTWTDEFNLREEINKIKTILYDKNFENIPDKVYLQCLSAMFFKSVSQDDIMNIPPEQIKNNISVFKESLLKAVDFLSTEFNVFNFDVLPYTHQIIPISYYYFRVKLPKKEDIKMLKSWFWRASFSRRYADSTNVRLNEDIKFIDELIGGREVDIDRFKAYNLESFLFEEQYNPQSPTTKAFKLLLAQKKPTNLISGNTIDIGSALDPHNKKQFHHVFPKKYLEKKKYSKKEYNSLLNICFIDAANNRKILDSSPSNYLTNSDLELLENEVNEEKLIEILESNFLPTELEIYRSDNYEKFLEERRKIVFKKYKELTRG